MIESLGNEDVTTTGDLPLGGPGFRHHLDELDLAVRALSTLVVDGIPRATEAFLRGDEALAQAMLADHEGAAALSDRIDSAVSIEIALHAPFGSDLRFLVTVLRVAPALGRCLELTDHVVARRWVGPLLPASAASAFGAMGCLATAMWEEAARAWREVDPTAARHLDEMNRRLEVAIHDLPSLLRQPDLTPLAAMDAIMVGRFLERLGAHAVDFANRLRWYATGR